jgi:RNA polymerase sigma-70 factor (ECF subfamily)
MLSRKAQPHADRIVFIERLEPSDQHSEDLDTARLVTRFQAGERDIFAELYMRYFDRVYGYFSVALNDRHTAEDLAQQVFAKVLEALPRYERRRRSLFRAWLFTIARNEAITELKRRGRSEVTAPEGLERARNETEPDGHDLPVLDWLSDRELALFVERLPLAQRQVLVLRYMLGFDYSEIAGILGRSVVDVRSLNSRGLRYLRERLIAVGRAAPTGRQRNLMRTRVRWARVASSRRWALHR